jgi:hypothetical protein
MFDKDDLRGIVLFLSLMTVVAGLALLVGSWDLPAGVSLGKHGFTLAPTLGNTILRPYAFTSFCLSVILAGIYKIKRLWE